MIPKKPIILYKQVAEDLNQSESLVDTFMTFYYKEVRKLLSNLSHTKINIDGLGQMVVKPAHGSPEFWKAYWDKKKANGWVPKAKAKVN
ncbi:MAG: hypothetical protein EBT39_06210 [Sphingobacteriia bacterium]|nr:hypothetical protein [Candidatus Fonsibacter lacus]